MALAVSTVVCAAVAASGLAGTAAAAEPSQVGAWTAPASMTAIAEHLVVLPGTGKVLYWNSGATASVLDPATGMETPVPVEPNIGCGGHAVLPDGRIVALGGWTRPDGGFSNKSTVIFDPSTETWSPASAMNSARWYPSAIKLPSGGVLAVSGSGSNRLVLSNTPEVFDAGANTWTAQPTATEPIPYYPFLHVLPDGRVAQVGASEEPTSTKVLDPSTMTWSTLDPNVFEAGSSTMYRPGKILKAGIASDGNTPERPSLATAYVLDTTAPSPAFRQVDSMEYPRAFLNLTTLPDGTVLATGGETTADGINVNNAVLPAELWSPETETWTTLASMTTARLYHSSAALLPDGRVFVSGTGNNPNVPNMRNYEIFSPPYLFKGARPTITSAPSSATLGSEFFVATPNGADIASAALVATAAVTHSIDMNSRYVPLTFTQSPGGLTLQAPANANFAPPGPYMLFLVNSQGVPSVASFVSMQAGSDAAPPVVSVTAPVAGATVSGSVSLSASASDNVGVSSVQFLVDGAPVGAPDSAAPYSVAWDSTVVADGAHTVSARATDAAGNVGTAAGVSVTVSNAGPPPAGITVDAKVFKDGRGVQTSPSLSTTGAGLLVAFVSSDGPSSGATATVSGGGLTWSLARRANARGGTSEVWTAPVSGAVANVTVTSTLSAANYYQSLTVVAYKGASGVGASVAANGTTGAQTATITTTGAGSQVVGVGNDWDGAVARTLGPDQVMLHEYLEPTAGTFWAQSRAATTPAAGTAVTINTTAPTNHRWNLVVAEVLAAGSPAAPASAMSTASFTDAALVGRATPRATFAMSLFTPESAYEPIGPDAFFCGAGVEPEGSADRAGFWQTSTTPTLRRPTPARLGPVVEALAR